MRKAVFAAFRVYAPNKEFFDKAWVLPDVEKVAAQ